MIINQNKDLYNADIYLRLSKEDGDKEESDSIINQKELILDFLKAKTDIKVHAIRIDDGYSGVNFERPAFQEMLEDIKKGIVNCVITKDLSRFGRNHIEAGKFIEKIFPYLGVRFIAINDHYDSAEGDMQAANIIVPFKNLINDAYCRDISVKIRSNLEVKRKNGEFVGAFAPYGYQKCDTDKHKLVEDREAAEIVRYIFKLYLQGNSAYKIAEILNREDVLTPMDYKREKGSAFYTGFKRNLKSQWNHTAVLRILSSPVYMGTLIQGKNTTPNYKVKKKIRKDRDKWNIAEHVHEAIISPEEYITVQELLQRDTRSGTSEDKLYHLSGLVKCGDCNANMVRKTIPSGNKKFVYYVCGNNKGNKLVCSSHRINAKALEETVLKLLNHQIDAILDMEEIWERLRKTQDLDLKKERRNIRMAEKREEILKYQNLRLGLYEDYKSSLITKDEYLELKEIYEKRIQAAEQALYILEEQTEVLASGQGNNCKWINEFKKYGKLQSLSREVAVSLIDNIFVFEKKKGDRYPRIEVCFRYADEFRMSLKLIEDLEREGEENVLKEAANG